jgi:predicted extracellular nuclease
MSFRILPVLAISLSLALLACGDDEGGPAGPGTAPSASELTAEASASQNSIDVSWTPCSDSDFEEYRLYRSLNSDIEEDPGSATLVDVFVQAGDTSMTDIGLAWGETYYYALQTRDSEGLYAWSNEDNATTPDSGGGGGGDYLTCYEIQGQAGSSPYLDDTVSVIGVVSVGGGEFYHSSSSYAVLCDPSGGPWTGLVVFGDSTASLQRGDSVVVSGTVQEYYGITELCYITRILDLGSGASIPAAEVLTTGELSTAADPEQWEGVLVRVENVTVSSDSLGYGEWSVTDGSGDCRVDDLGDYTYTPAIGDVISSLTGILWYSFDDFKLEPRDGADISE